MMQINVIVHADHLRSLNDVAAALSERGMSVESILETVGVISGSVPDHLRPSLLAVPGVAAIEDSRSVRLPPPEADIQ